MTDYYRRVACEHEQSQLQSHSTWFVPCCEMTCLCPNPKCPGFTYTPAPEVGALVEAVKKGFPHSIGDCVENERREDWCAPCSWDFALIPFLPNPTGRSSDDE